jgi:hypothetical protein
MFIMKCEKCERNITTSQKCEIHSVTSTICNECCLVCFCDMLQVLPIATIMAIYEHESSKGGPLEDEGAG